MSDRDIEAHCQSCGEEAPCRRYGPGDPPALICVGCAQKQAERVNSIARRAAEQLRGLGR